MKKYINEKQNLFDVKRKDNVIIKGSTWEKRNHQKIS